VTEELSSNWRELNNLVELLEQIFMEQELIGSEFFIFTDNSTPRKQLSGRALQSQSGCLNLYCT
jgi:hypothetical protein